MTRRPRLRKLTLTAHIVSSVGWLGAVGVFLALSVVGLTGQDAPTVRGAYLAMEAIGWFALVPLSFASLVTGLVQGLGTKWGLFRHFWVIVKLVINLVATAVLLLYMQTLGYLAGAVAETSTASLEELQNPSPVLHAGAALLLLLLAAGLSVYKPRGVTRYGQRKQDEERAAAAAGAMRRRRPCPSGTS